MIDYICPKFSFFQEMFIRKAIGIFVAGLGIGMAVIIFSLIAHKGYVYHKKGIAA